MYRHHDEHFELHDGFTVAFRLWDRTWWARSGATVLRHAIVDDFGNLVAA